MGMRQVVVIGSPWIMRQGVRKFLKRNGLFIVAEGDNCDDACADCDQAIKPVLILVIVSRSEQFEEGLSSLRAASARFPGAKLILLAEGVDEGGTLAVRQLGANALLSPKLSFGMLESSVQLVLMNQNLFPVSASSAGARSGGLHTPARPSAAVSEQLVEPVPGLIKQESRTSLGTRSEEDTVPERPSAALLNLVWNNSAPAMAEQRRPLLLSEREWEILGHLANGGSNKAIARELGIAETTVKVHVKSLLRKLGVANRTQAAIWALNHRQPAGEPDIQVGLGD